MRGVVFLLVRQSSLCAELGQHRLTAVTSQLPAPVFSAFLFVSLLLLPPLFSSLTRTLHLSTCPSEPGCSTCNYSLKNKAFLTYRLHCLSQVLALSLSLSVPLSVSFNLSPSLPLFFPASLPLLPACLHPASPGLSCKN